jgi:uncharacterized heparinase superfamily protein
MVELPPTREAAGGGATALFARLRRHAIRALAAGPFYRRSLIGRAPEDLRHRIGEHWPGEPKRGAAILAGDIELAGELVRNPSPAWFPPAAGPEWLAAWHGFSWLADLASAGEEAREAARALITAARRSGHGTRSAGATCRLWVYAWIVHPTSSPAATPTSRYGARCWRAGASCGISAYAAGKARRDAAAR